MARTNKIPGVAWGAIPFAVVFIPWTAFVIMHPDPEYETRRPDIEAPPYIWPNGCMPKRYQEGDSIERACLKKDYLFSNWHKYGLPEGRGSAHAYRVGNDAASIPCGFWKDCKVDFIVENAFHQPTRTAASWPAQ